MARQPEVNILPMAGSKKANKKEKEQEHINKRRRNRFDFSVSIKEYLKNLESI